MWCFSSEKLSDGIRHLSSALILVTWHRRCHAHVTWPYDGVLDWGEVVPASVTVDGGGSGSYLDCLSDASLEPPAIAVYNPGVLGVYRVFIIPHMMANRGWVFWMFFESLFEGSFHFADVIGFTVVARQFVHYTAFVLGMVLVCRGH